MLRREVIPVLGLGVVVLLAYWPSLPGGFHFDDFQLMLESPYVSASSFSYRLFLEEYGGRPLTLWTFHWNYRWFGEDPWSYRAFSLLLHLVGTAFLYAWVHRETADRNVALLASAVFALHPLQTQAVNYVWSRSVLLMFCFGIGSLLLARWPWLSLFCFQLAIWSRTDGVIFLVPLLLARAVPADPARRLSAAYRNAAAVSLVLINLVAFVVFMSKAKPREVGWTHPHVVDYWVSQTVAFWKYVALMLWPVGLNVDHDFVVRGHWVPLLAALGLVVAALVLWRIRPRHQLIVVGAVWIGLVLAPAALVPNSDPFNESRAYPAVAGFAVLVAGLFQTAWRKLGRRPVLAAAGALLLAMVPVTILRNTVWHSDLALWQDAVKKSPQKARAHYNLGAAWSRVGDIEAAETSFSRALALEPEDDLACAALGYCAESKGDWALALERYEKAVSLNSRNRYADEGRRRVLRQVGTGQPKQRL